jgi:hypothetical protein
MVDAGKFLIFTVHEVAIAAELAITAGAGEESDSNTLADRPTLNSGTERIDLSYDLMARNPRPFDRK